MTLTSNLSILTALAISLSASVAMADDPVAPKPQHQQENISQINGQLVEVGGHNKYDYSYKRFNIAANPLGAVVGIIGVQASMAVSSMVALRGDITLYDSPFDNDDSGIEATASAAVYFKHMYQGLYLEPGFMVRRMTNGDGDTHSTTGPQTLVGYHWMWDSGLNAAIAFGPGRNMAKQDEEFGTDKVFFNGYARFGYAF